MSIGETASKIKGFCTTLEEREVLMILLIVFVGIVSFGLGRLSVESVERSPVTLTIPHLQATTAAVPNEVNRELRAGAVVATKNGEAYYLPFCGSANRIKEENKIYFSSADEARAAGYRPAQNCPGLE